jgi:hypothetical protein
MSTYYIPARDEKFLDWAKNLVDYASAHAAAMNLESKRLKTLRSQVKTYSAAYSAAVSPTHNRVDIRVKNEAKAVLRKALSSFVRQYLAFNDKVTIKDRGAMAIPIYGGRSGPKPDPATLVESSVKVGLRQLVISFRDQGSNRRAKPAGCDAAEIRWAVLDKPPESETALYNTEISTRTPCILNFNETDRKKTVYFCLRWRTLSGKKGRWGEIFSATVA